MQRTVEAVRAFLNTPEAELAADDGNRLLHLVRLGFATLLFDLKDVNAAPTFTRGLAEMLPQLEERMGNDAFYRTLLAQVLWFDDKEASEAQWERAAELEDAELAWNARGTWYKEAERDPAKAEQTYRRGLSRAKGSALLLHNLAQLLVDRAGRSELDRDDSLQLLREADGLLRDALRADCPKGLRRHIHATRDRLNDMRSSLPPRHGKPDEAGARGQGPPRKPRGQGGRRGGGGHWAEPHKATGNPLEPGKRLQRTFNRGSSLIVRRCVPRNHRIRGREPLWAIMPS